MMLAGLLQGHCPKEFWQKPFGYSSFACWHPALIYIHISVCRQLLCMHVSNVWQARPNFWPLFACVSARKSSVPAVHHQPCDACRLYIHPMRDVHSVRQRRYACFYKQHIPGHSRDSAASCRSLCSSPSLYYACTAAVERMNAHCSDVEASLYGAQRLVNAWSRCTHDLTSLQWLASPHTWEGRYEQSLTWPHVANAQILLLLCIKLLWP